MGCQFQFTPRYNGPLEYITMWLCLFLSLPTCELLKNLEGACDFGSLLKSTRLSMSKEQPIHPHPLDVLLQLS